MDCIVYLVVYDGQTGSVYNHTFSSYSAALEEMEQLREQYPDRKYYILDKDVS